MVTGNTSKFRKFGLASHQPEQWDKLIAFAEDCPKFAYIKHDKDNAEPHYHFYFEFINPRSVSGLSKTLDIPENMLEIIKNKTGYLVYLTHSDEKSQKEGKFHYDISEITTNLPSYQFEHFSWSQMYDNMSSWIDDWYNGNITHSELMKRVKPYLDGTSPKSTFETLLKVRVMSPHTPDDFSRIPVEEDPDFIKKKIWNGGLVNRSKFLVPNEF